MAEPGSRFEPSVVTFGLLGRLVCTLLALAVAAWFVMFAGVAGLPGAVIWMGWVMPRILRDAWQRAALPSTDLTQLQRATERENETALPRTPHLVFDPTQEPPKRW